MSQQQNNDDYGEKTEKMLMLTISAAKGIAPMATVVRPLSQIANGNVAPPEARELAAVCVRILNGERDPIALVDNLSPEMTEMVWEALDQIEQPLPESNTAEREEISFEELVEQTAEACSGNVMLWQRLWDFTEELSTDERLPADIRVLGTVLRKILAGERQLYILNDLSIEHRWAVEQLLAWLNAQAVEPDSTE